MNKRFASTLFMVSIIICFFSCNLRSKTQELLIESEIDPIVQYCDTIVGKCNGKEIETLICEPVGKLIVDGLFGEFYTEWRVYTAKGGVQELKIGNTLVSNL